MLKGCGHTHERQVGQQAKTLHGLEIYRPVGHAQHDQSPSGIAIVVQMVMIAREPRRQRQNTTDQLLRVTATLLELLAVETPYWLAVTKLKIEIDSSGDSRGRRMGGGFLGAHIGREQIADAPTRLAKQGPRSLRWRGAGLVPNLIDGSATGQLLSW